MYQSPRWSSGYPRMILKLVLGFESHVGRTFWVLEIRERYPLYDQMCQSPRWSSGYPRMLLKLVLGFESHVGRTFWRLFAKKKKQRNLMLRAPSSVSKRNSMRVNEGRKGSSLIATKMRARTVVGRGEKSLLSDPGSELRLRR